MATRAWTISGSQLPFPRSRVLRARQRRHTQVNQTRIGFFAGQRRFWNVLLRSIHLATMAVAVGGLVFDVSRDAVSPWLFATVGSGMLLALVEAWPNWSRWLREGRGLVVVAKIILLATIPWLWDYRSYVLFAAIVVASIGSHMPGRFRYRVMVGKADGEKTDG